MKRNVLFYSIMMMVAVFVASCKEWYHEPDSPGGKTWGGGVCLVTDTAFILQPGDTVYRAGDTVYIELHDTIHSVVHDTINGVIIVHDTVYVTPEPTKVLGFTRTSDQRNYGYYADDEQTTTMSVDGTPYASTQVNYGAEVTAHGIDTMWLENKSKVTYNSPIIANARRTPVGSGDRRYNTFDGEINVTSQDVELAMNDNFNSNVAEVYEDASVTYEGVKRNLLYTRVVDTRYISHEDELVENDTVVKNGYVYKRKHRVARIQVKRVEYPQVGEEVTLFDTLVVDSRDANFSTPLYVKDHEYEEPTDTVPPTPVDPEPDPEPEPGYKNGLIVEAWFTYAIDMSSNIHDALLLKTKDSTLIAITDESYQMVSGVRYVYNPEEVTVSDDISAYNGVSYNGNVVPAVLRDENGTLRWYYDGNKVCSFKDASLASLVRSQSTTLASTKMQDLTRKVSFKNVGTTTHIQTPYYTVVISE